MFDGIQDDIRQETKKMEELKKLKKVAKNEKVKKVVNLIVECMVAILA